MNLLNGLCSIFVRSIKAMLLIVACKYRLIQKEQPQGLTRIQAPELKASKEEQDGLLNGGREMNGGVSVVINKDEPHKPEVSSNMTMNH